METSNPVFAPGDHLMREKKDLKLQYLLPFKYSVDAGQSPHIFQRMDRGLFWQFYILRDFKINTTLLAL